MSHHKRLDHRPKVGDWIDVDVTTGGLARRGQVVEVLGDEGHERYRVRWDEVHESIHFPSDGTHVVEPGSLPHRREVVLH